jgi:cysteine-rich repeat protein
MMVAMRARMAGLMLVLASGCGDDAPATSETGSSTSTTGQTTTSTPGSSDTGSADSSGSPVPTGTSGQPGTETGFEPPVAECGNGFVEDGEECDDANDQDNDGCSNTCLLPCGIEWTAVSLPPSDLSNFDPRDVVQDARGRTSVVAYLEEIVSDQRGNQTSLDEDALVLQFDADGTPLLETRVGLDEEGDLDVVGVAVDGDGAMYVAATVEFAGCDTVSDIRLIKLASDGEVVWSATHDSAVDTADDLAFGVAIGGDGNPVVSGQVRAGDGDDDVWVGSFDAGDGAELWTATWSGTPNGGFSTDDGGPLSVGSDGTVYVLAREYIDFQTASVRVLAFDGVADTGTSVFVPEVAPGQLTLQPGDLAVADDDTLLLSFIRVLPAGPEYYAVRVDPQTGDEQWRIDGLGLQDATPVDSASDFTISGVAPLSDAGAVVMGQHERAGDGTAWVETWVARFDATDTLSCMFVRESPQLSLVPGSLRGRAVATNAAGRAVVAGQEFADGVQSLWVGAFRPL